MSLSTIADSCADALFAAKRRMLGANRARRARLYGVGAGKTGTHSIAAMFSDSVISRHEPDALELVDKIFDWKAGRISEEKLTNWLRVRDQKLASEVDCSNVNFEILDILLREFPDARFVLTIRECYSWCNSVMNHELRFAGQLDPRWLQLADTRYRINLCHYESEEYWLKQKGFYPLESYFSYWHGHNTAVLHKIPAERLLVVRTDQIRQKALEIADFAGLPRRTIRLDRTHEFKNPSKHDIIRQIDRDLLEAKVEKHCRPLMTRFFPEIKSLDDAKL